MSLTEDCKKELQWWVDNIVSSHNVITHRQPSKTLPTDASQNGWGAVYNDPSTGGFWSDEEKSHHINYLELLAVFMGLQNVCFKTHYNTHLWILTDNKTAIALLNHMGTSHSDPCNRLGKQIWEGALTVTYGSVLLTSLGFTLPKLISNQDEPTIIQNGWLIGST